MRKFMYVLVSAYLVIGTTSVVAETNVLSDISVDEMAQLNNTLMEKLQGEFPPGLGSLYVYNAVNFSSLEEATLDFWRTDTNGNLLLDANNLPIPVNQNPFKGQTSFYVPLPYGR